MPLTIAVALLGDAFATATASEANVPVAPEEEIEWVEQGGPRYWRRARRQMSPRPPAFANIKSNA